LEVADIIRACGDSFIAWREGRLSVAQKRVLHALALCRTAALGGHLERCDNPGCRHQRPAYDSCRNRHCPKCQTLDRARWVQARQAQLLPIPYFHVVFTLPHQLAALVQANARFCYNLLFEAAASSLQKLSADPKHLGAQIGFFALLHTWGQQMTFHPHLHLVVTGGGLSPQGQSWIPCRQTSQKQPFFLPVKRLSARFRRLFCDGLQAASLAAQLQLPTPLAFLADPQASRSWWRQLRHRKWVVYAKPPWGSPAQVVEYLGRYTHRVAISNHRLLKLENHQVSFYWRDYRHGNQIKIMSLSAEEFLARFLRHVVPEGFVRIRHYGLLANSQVQKKIQQCRQLLGVEPALLLLPQPPRDWIQLLEKLCGQDVTLCPLCRQGHLRPLPIRLPASWERAPPQLLQPPVYPSG
jgi:hypothetical protein